MSLIDPEDEDACARAVERFEALGYTTILSIGALAENAIGSNCGQYVAKLRRDQNGNSSSQKSH